MSFLRNFRFGSNNLTENANIELQDIEEGSGSALTSVDIPIPDHLAYVGYEGDDDHSQSANPVQSSNNIPSSTQALQMANFPHETLPDTPHPPYAGLLDGDQDSQMVHLPLSNASYAPVMDSQMQVDYLMTSTENPNQFQFQLLPSAQIHPTKAFSRKRSLHEHEDPSKVHIVE